MYHYLFCLWFSFFVVFFENWSEILCPCRHCRLSKILRKITLRYFLLRFCCLLFSNFEKCCKISYYTITGYILFPLNSLLKWKEKKDTLFNREKNVFQITNRPQILSCLKQCTYKHRLILIVHMWPYMFM